MIPTLRTLTRKSKLGFGTYGDLTVQRILDMYMPLALVTPYYTITNINYTEDILLELKITEEYRIEKPSSNRDEYYRFREENGYPLKTRGAGRLGADKLRLSQRNWLKKEELQRKQHGH